MITEFLLGAAAATVASKKLKDKSKDEIKEMMDSGIKTTGKVVGAGVELFVDKINGIFVPQDKKQSETVEEIKAEEVEQSKVENMFK